MKLGPHILAALDGSSITKDVESLILDHHVLGFTLFSRNIEDAKQLTELNRDLQTIAHKAGYTLVLAVDQEGGRVARLKNPEFAKVPSMREWGQIIQKNSDYSIAYKLGTVLAEQVKAVGFNLDFAPLIDIDTNPDNPIIGDRSFSNDPLVVYECAKELMRAFKDQGVLSCLKHFPGHGDTTKDSHLELPYDARTCDSLKKCDLIPYHKLIKEDLVQTIMTAHVIYPDWDKDHTATTSKLILTDYLRGQLNYQSVIFSDDLLMKAIADNMGIQNAALEFFKCGGDAALVCEKPELSLEIIKELDATIQKDQILKNNLEQAQVKLRALEVQTHNNEIDISKLKSQHELSLSLIF